MNPRGRPALVLTPPQVLDHQVLELDARRRVYDVVNEYPGLHLREIARRASLDPNHAKYHLQYLERHGLASSRKEAGYWRFFPRSMAAVGTREILDPREKEALGVLRRPVPLHVVLVLLEKGPLSLTTLEPLVGVSRTTLHYHLRRMVDAGIATSRKVGRERLYDLVDHDDLLSLLARYRPPEALVQGFLDAWENVDLP